METVRTPDDRFAQLPDGPYTPRYTEVPDGDGGQLRIHHVDEGPADADPVLCLHGEPSWGYLYRKMIPPLVEAGHRVVVPDLVGFGRSDKPTERSDYSYNGHVEWMAAWLQALDLRSITLVCQDWGGLIGLRLAALEPDRFARVVVANTGLPTGEQRQSEAFLRWRQFSQESPSFHVGGIVNGGCTSDLSEQIVAAYDAPFPDDTYLAGARVFPALVPMEADAPGAADNRAAWQVFEQWEKPLLCAFSDSDPVTKGGDRPFRTRVPGGAEQPHTTIEDAGHFLQEDQGARLAQVVAEFIASAP